MAARRSSPKGTAARRKIRKVMREYRGGSLRSGSGAQVRSRKQAVAIALSEGRRTQRRSKKR